jgi:(S)-mandelate dehydrogenase
MPWKRRPFSGSNLARALNIADLRAVARRRVPHFVFEYVEGGAEEEASLRCNRAIRPTETCEPKFWDAPRPHRWSLAQRD